MWKAVVAAAVAVGTGLLALAVLLVVVVGTQAPRPGQPGVVCAPQGGGPGDPVAGFEGPQLAYAATIVLRGPSSARRNGRT